MNISENGKAMIKAFEGCRLEAYQDQVGVWTIGYGSTAGVRKGDRWTQQQADERFDEEVERFAKRVADLVKVVIAQARFDALVSLAYNIGLGALASSTLLRLLNQADYKGAACQFTVWNRAGAAFNPGLLKRRTEEMYHFCSARGDG